MCDIEGDIETVGLLVDSVISVSVDGQVSPGAVESSKNAFEVKGVYCCVGCSVEDVLPLLGHPRAVINNYVVNENYIPFEKDIVKEFTELALRAPGVCLVKEGEQLVGVLIDALNKARVLGAVTRVLPHYDQLKSKKNVLVLDADGLEELTDSQTVDLDNLAETGATVGIVSLDGYLLVQPPQGISNLTLILSHGYLVLQNFKVIWTRQSVDQASRANLSADEAIECKQSQVGSNEIFAVNAGIILPEPGTKHQMSLFGSHNAIVNYQAFKRCLAVYDSAQEARRGLAADPAK